MNPKFTDFVINLNPGLGSISIVTRLEVMLGYKKHRVSLESIENDLNEYDNISLTEEICRQATLLSADSQKKLKFKDLIIAATAIVRNKTLVTSDKDFLSFKKLKVKYIGA